MRLRPVLMRCSTATLAAAPESQAAKLVSGMPSGWSPMNTRGTPRWMNSR